MTEKEKEERRAKIKRVIKETEEAGLYETSEHLTSFAAVPDELRGSRDH